MAKQHSTRNHWLVTHGHSFVGQLTPEYRTWRNLIQRCHNPNHTAYSFYGGRGISVCTQWRKSFKGFLADVGLRPTIKHSIDRIDNNGNYEPGNCRWITHKQQCRNFRRNRNISFNGETICLAAWTERLGFSRNMLKYRLDNGWSVEDALTTPPKPKGKQICKVEGCASLSRGKGFCGKHYQQLRKGKLRVGQEDF